ncbi:LEA type 2 family protein [Halorhabdus amylolytica]|uniref:LEA type 2 family protein n=1 Tax=Halorhabdus amylolytica TaxID=2559573 RepID=UPI0010AB2FDF|nr:LEA type 2 family protein [Halorhabdus amylolytica]
MSRRRAVLKAVAVLVVFVAAIALALVTGLLGAPSAGIEDVGDWGTVTEERTEVITTLWVENPNPIGLSLGDSVAVDYRLQMNDVELAEGTTQGINVRPGNNTIEASTSIHNEQLSAWWVAFVENNETIDIRAEPTVRIDGLVSTAADLPSYETTGLSDSTPIVTSFSKVASGLEGQYTLSDLTSSQRDSLVGSGLLDANGVLPGSDGSTTVGYEIRRGWATWGDVAENTTTLRLHFQLHNPSETVPVPAEPENLGVDIAMNDVEMFSARGADTSLANPGDFTLRESIDRRVLMPGETTEAVYAVEMDNDRIDEWFRSHVRQDERTEVRTELQLVFSVGDFTVDVPEEKPAGYTCNLQTGIFVDGQETDTTCGEASSLGATG